MLIVFTGSVKFPVVGNMYIICIDARSASAIVLFLQLYRYYNNIIFDTLRIQIEIPLSINYGILYMAFYKYV